MSLSHGPRWQPSAWCRASTAPLPALQAAPRIPNAPSDGPPRSAPDQHPRATLTPHPGHCLAPGTGCEAGNCPSVTGVHLPGRSEGTALPGPRAAGTSI